MDIDRNAIKQLYENVETVWPSEDLWHMYSKHTIEHYLLRQKWSASEYVLNAGSGGNTYGLDFINMHHRDIAKNKISSFKDYSVGTIEELPFGQNSFDKIICVGSVINYCDAVSAISEFARVIKPNGILFLEFESSYGFEHRKQSYYKEPATVVKLKYFDELWTQWVYSPQYITNSIKEMGFKILHKKYFHIFSGYIYSIIHNENKATKWTCLDSFLDKTALKKHANNIILKCIKL